MLVEFELFKHLEIDKKNDFMDHIKYISNKLVNAVVNYYLIQLIGGKFISRLSEKVEFLVTEINQI